MKCLFATIFLTMGAIFSNPGVACVIDDVVQASSGNVARLKIVFDDGSKVCDAQRVPKLLYCRPSFAENLEFAAGSAAALPTVGGRTVTGLVYSGDLAEYRMLTSLSQSWQGTCFGAPEFK